MSLLARTPRPHRTGRAVGLVRAHAPAPWGWGLSGLLLGALLSVLWFAPARWLAGAVRQASAGQVLLQDARGTVWSGSAQFTLTGGQLLPAAALAALVGSVLERCHFAGVRQPFKLACRDSDGFGHAF